MILYSSVRVSKDSAHEYFAGVAQSVEQLIRNQQVSGSSPLTSSIKKKQD